MRFFRHSQCSLLLLLICTWFACIPSASASLYHLGQVIPIDVNSLASPHTQVPYSYSSLPLCRATGGKSLKVSFGQELAGEHVISSDYKVHGLVNEDCSAVCRLMYTETDVKLMRRRIQEQYRVQMILDDLPAASSAQYYSRSHKRLSTILEDGFLLGERAGMSEDVALYNMLALTIYYLPEGNNASDGFYITGFEVTPRSAKGKASCDSGLRLVLKEGSSYWVDFLYSVKWVRDTRISSAYERWNAYLRDDERSQHVLGLVQSLVVLLLVTGLAALVMVRRLRRELQKSLDEEEFQEETGWKLVQFDVFRPPSRVLFLSTFVGFGLQILATLFATSVFGLIGAFHPANRGGALTGLPIIYALLGVVAGYFSARTYKRLQGQYWRKCFLFVATLFPGTAFVFVVFNNFFLLHAKSSGAYSVGTIFALFFLWMLHVLCVGIGSYAGFRAPPSEMANRTNLIPRYVPAPVWYLRPTVQSLLGGVIPFGVAWLELHYILTILWSHLYYYTTWGFLFLSVCVLVVISAEVAIIMVYFQLCGEDYHWWWRSFLSVGSSGVYFFCYTIFLYFNDWSMYGFTSALIYFSYNALFAVAMGLATGSIGFLACFYFVQKIYSSHLA